MIKYFRLSGCPNKDYNSGECSFAIIRSNGTSHYFDFCQGRHNVQAGTIATIGRGVVETIYPDSEGLMFKNKIFEEYKTEQNYMEAIEKYTVMAELIS